MKGGGGGGGGGGGWELTGLEDFVIGKNRMGPERARANFPRLRRSPVLYIW